HRLVGRLLGALPPSDLLARGIPLRLERLDADKPLAPLAVEREQFVEYGRECGVAAPHQAGGAPGGILPQTLEVEHGALLVGEAGLEVLIPAVVVGEDLERDG